jgi:hypothetical protein
MNFNPQFRPIAPGNPDAVRWMNAAADRIAALESYVELLVVENTEAWCSSVNNQERAEAAEALLDEIAEYLFSTKAAFWERVEFVEAILAKREQVSDKKEQVSDKKEQVSDKKAARMQQRIAKMAESIDHWHDVAEIWETRADDANALLNEIARLPSFPVGDSGHPDARAVSITAINAVLAKREQT